MHYSGGNPHPPLHVKVSGAHLAPDSRLINFSDETNNDAASGAGEAYDEEMLKMHQESNMLIQNYY